MIRLPHIGWSGIGLGSLALLICELPLIIAFFGFGGLLVFDLPGWVELVGIGLAVAGTGLLLYLRLWPRPASQSTAEEMR